MTRTAFRTFRHDRVRWAAYLPMPTFLRHGPPAPGRPASRGTGLSRLLRRGRPSGLWILGLLLAYGAWPVCPCAAQGHGPARVEVAAVVRREVAPTLRLVGTVRPRLRTVVAAEVSGLVVELPVDEGDRVTQGQLLCKLRDAPRRFAHAQALARQTELTAVLTERTADLEKAKYEAQRTTRLWEQQRSTDKERHDAQADYGAARGRVDQARHAVDAQKAVVQTLADDLARTEIRAPCGGHIVAKHTEIGSWVDEGGDIVELVDLSTVRIRLSVPESMIAYCPVGVEAGVSVEAIGGVFAGRVSRVIPVADEPARTFPVEIDIPNPKGALKAGMFARGTLPSGPKAERLVVPKDAVVVRGAVSMVYVVRGSEKGQIATPLPVEIVSEVADRVAVRAEGLAAGDQVIVRGNEYMFGPGPVIAVPRVERATTPLADKPPVAPAVEAQAGKPPAEPARVSKQSRLVPSRTGATRPGSEGDTPRL